LEKVKNGATMKKKLVLVFLLSLIVIAATGCNGNEGEDTRQYIDTIGVVFTNNADDVINELYVFPIAIDGTAILEQDMGPDLIKNTGNTRRIGSFGVTIELLHTSYNVMARGRQQDIYVFGGVPLSNICEVVLAYDRGTGGEPTLTVIHRNGSVDVVEGVYLAPGDAPNHTHVPLLRSVSLQFNISNNTNKEITFISIREADHPSKGEVELYIGNLTANRSASVNYRLFEEDQEITEWLLYIETADGESIQFDEAFNPWETTQLVLSMDADKIVYNAS